MHATSFRVRLHHLFRLFFVCHDSLHISALFRRLEAFKTLPEVGVGAQQKSEALKGQHFFIDAWDVYGLFEFHPVPESRLSLRMSFVNSGLQSVLKKEAESSATSVMSPSVRLKQWFRLWLDFVETLL